MKKFENDPISQEVRSRFHQHAYAKLLLMQIQKVQKAARLDCLFALLGPVGVKAACKRLVKLTPGVDPTKLCFSLFSDFRC